MYTLKAVNGKRKTSEVEPNMLAKLFGYSTTEDIEYPHSVWDYLNQVPASNLKSKKRLDVLVDRWIADSNISGFTNRTSKAQLDVITASVSQKKGLSISTLSARQTMLLQLSAEILKMKRMLLELAMVAQGDKQFTAQRQTLSQNSALAWNRHVSGIKAYYPPMNLLVTSILPLVSLSWKTLLRSTLLLVTLVTTGTSVGYVLIGGEKRI